jgi:hypothetical protein
VVLPAHAKSADEFEAVVAIYSEKSSRNGASDNTPTSSRWFDPEAGSAENGAFAHSALLSTSTVRLTTTRDNA